MGRGGPNPNKEVMMKTTFSVEASARYFFAIIFKENEIFEKMTLVFQSIFLGSVPKLLTVEAN